MLIGNNQKLIIKKLKRKPFFADDVGLDSTTIRNSVRRLNAKGKKIVLFNHKSGKEHKKNITPHFCIIFKERQRKKAWGMILDRFDEVRCDKEINRRLRIPIIGVRQDVQM